MEIKRFTSLNDISNAFYKLKDYFFHFDGNLELFINKIYQYGACFVACENNNIYGLIAIYANDTKTNNAFITSLLVDINQRNKGIATKLVNAAENYSLSNGMNTISLHVNSANIKAIALYEKLNYHFTSDNNNIITMIKLLKIINVTRSSIPSYEEYCEAIKPIFESNYLTNMGPLHNEFASKVSDYLGCQNVSLFTNGHMALCIAIQALELKGEVITTPFTFASTTHAIVQCGLTPVFCDINPDTYTIDVDKIEELITEKTSAIIPVHVYGNVCDVKKIDAIAKKYNLKVIYDAAHVFGVEIENLSVGSYGDISMFSFHATKVFNTIEGGCLTYSDSSLKQKISSLRNFGITDPESVDYIGTNAKMNEFQAAMGLCNLKYINTNIEERGLADKIYRSHLEGVRGIRLSPIQFGVKRNYAYFPVVFDGYKYTRDEVAEKLATENIYARKYFYPITNEFNCYKNKFVGYTPIAKEISEKVLTLPMYAGLSEEDINRICNIILK